MGESRSSTILNHLPSFIKLIALQISSPAVRLKTISSIPGVKAGLSVIGIRGDISGEI